MPTTVLSAGTVVPGAEIRFRFDNTYVRDLPAGDFYEFWQPATAPQPEMLFFNAALAAELGADIPADITSDALAAMFSGNRLPEGAQPIAQAYAGHQFGHFSPRLGDGRALLVGEVVNPHGQRRDIALKGSGRTPFSRGGDGKAAVGPMLREVLVGECMHALGIPTTRALAVVATGEPVFREGPLPGAVLTRVASSHLRVGTFEYFAARRMKPALQQLFDYSRRRHDPAIEAGDEAPLAFFRAVSARQAQLLAQWTSVGFIHGVMNTDNMALSGETIDYGPCAFMEAYDPATVFSSIDHQGRYAFGNQPAIAQWNLARLAECLLPLMPDEEAAVQALSGVLDDFLKQYSAAWLARAAAKLGLPADHAAVPDLRDDWLALLQTHQVDYTLAWRCLCDAAEGNANTLVALFRDPKPVCEWIVRWQWLCDGVDRACGRDAAHGAKERAAAMRQVNPAMIARNHAVEAALKAASDEGDLAPFERLLDAVRDPYTDRPEFADLARPAPAADTACYRTFCGT